MAEILDVSDDFMVWDFVRPDVPFRSVRRGGSPDSFTLLAKRRAITTAEVMSSGGAYTKSDVKLLIPKKPIAFPFIPKPGDEWDDVDGATYTVLEVPLNKIGQTWHCISRDLAIAHNLRDEVTVEIAVPDEDALGAVRRNQWKPIYTMLSCRLIPEESGIVEERGVEGTQIRYNVPVSRTLPELVTRARECRLRVTRHPDPKILGAVLDVESYVSSESITDLSIVRALRKA